MSCRVVCISHATGAGGEEIGRLASESLGFVYIDEEIISRAAGKAGIDPREVADEERRKSLVARMLDAVGQGGGGLTWAAGAVVPHGVAEGLDSDEIRAVIRDTVEQMALRGNAVIVAHAASYAVRPGSDVLRVLVTASVSTRAKRIREEEGLDEGRAARAIKVADANRRDYLRRFYDVDEELPTYYDVVVNTDVLSIERAADLVSRAAAG